jgi:hypothetical protein
VWEAGAVHGSVKCAGRRGGSSFARIGSFIPALLYLADYGGGVSCNNSSPELASCMIVGNRAGFEGSGVDWMVSERTVNNCMVIENKAQDATGIYRMIKKGGVVRLRPFSYKLL